MFRLRSDLRRPDRYAWHAAEQSNSNFALDQFHKLFSILRCTVYRCHRIVEGYYPIARATPRSTYDLAHSGGAFSRHFTPTTRRITHKHRGLGKYLSWEAWYWGLLSRLQTLSNTTHTP